MDIASVVGLIGALVLIVMAMGDPGPFVDTASLLIVMWFDYGDHVPLYSSRIFGVRRCNG